jgi:hypothetical protein
MLSPTPTVKNEYHCDWIKFPGAMQYKEERETLIRAGNEAETIDNIETCGYVVCEQSAVNLNRVVPHTKKAEKWKILLMFKCEKGDETWLKAALINTETDEIALLTSTNTKENLNRPIDSLVPGWWVGHYRMSAPLCFWIELKNRLVY